MKEIEQRRAAVIASEQRFREKRFDWRKSATCIHLVRFQASQMGHKLPTVPRFRSALTAKRALLSTGFQTLPGFLDSRFERVAPAFMRVGDILAVPGSEGFEACYIKCDKTKFLGWHQDTETCTIIDLTDEDIRNSLGAWRL